VGREHATNVDDIKMMLMMMMMMKKTGKGGDLEAGVYLGECHLGWLPDEGIEKGSPTEAMGVGGTKGIPPKADTRGHMMIHHRLLGITPF
jgi:hypothetical protein